MTDVELDARVSALEENTGGNGLNGKNYFRNNFSGVSIMPLGKKDCTCS